MHNGTKYGAMHIIPCYHLSCVYNNAKILVKICNTTLYHAIKRVRLMIFFNFNMLQQNTKPEKQIA